MRTSLLEPAPDAAGSGFDSVAVGPENRKAVAAVRRVIAAPGSAFNPLLVFGPGGAGKSHLIMAAAVEARRIWPADSVRVLTGSEAVRLFEPIPRVREAEFVRREFASLHTLLIDDFEVVAAHMRAQSVLLSGLEVLLEGGRQVILASDRPPESLNRLDGRLHSRLVAGLIVPLSAPGPSLRGEILRLALERRGSALPPALLGILAVAEPVGGLDEVAETAGRILELQADSGALPDPSEVASWLGLEAPPSQFPAPDSGVEVVDLEFPGDPSGLPAHVSPEESIEAAIAEAESGGFRTDGLRRSLAQEDRTGNVEATVGAFRFAVRRLRGLRERMAALGESWMEEGPSPLLDPDRLFEAELWVASALERRREFPPLPEGPTLEELRGRHGPLLLRSLERLVSLTPPERARGLVVEPDDPVRMELLVAAGTNFRLKRADPDIVMLSGRELTEDYGRVLASGLVPPWRARLSGVHLLVVDAVEGVAGNPGVQEELAYLLDTLERKGAAVLLGSPVGPEGLSPLEPRLLRLLQRSILMRPEPSPEQRVEARSGSAPPASVPARDPAADLRRSMGIGSRPVRRWISGSGSSPGWIPTPEKVVWVWPEFRDLLPDTEDAP